jgi:hypothetical protein
MKTGWSFYENPESGEPYLRSTRDLKVTEFHLNEPISDELFEMTIQPYVEIQDRRSGKLRRYQKWRSLLDKSLPSFEGIDLQDPLASKSGSILICFVDIDQRPSRHMLQGLAGKYKTLGQDAPHVLLIQVSDTSSETLKDWREKLQIPFEVAQITGDAETVRKTWGAESLPWLILTDKQHIVRAEGFGIAELDDKMPPTANAK